MTHPGGGGNDINLATMWIPLMPETSHMGEEMEKSGKESRRRWEQGFNSGGSPESIGSSFGAKLSASIGNEFKNFQLPFGGNTLLDKFSNDIDQKLVAKLRGEATSALQGFRQEFDNLTAAQERSAEADAKIAAARKVSFDSLDVGKQQQMVQLYGSEADALEHVTTKASIMLPMIQEQTAAHNNLAEATTKTNAAHEEFATKQSKLQGELSKTADGGKILAGVMGGAMVVGAQLAVQGIESVVDAIAEGFEKGIELTVELAKETVELGEKYEQISIQITEFSTASGDALENLETSAQHVFSTLDVAGADTGKTMAQFSSILGASGDDVAGLTRHVVDLQGRFTSLKAVDLGAIFTAFKTPAAEADKSLASLLQSARGSGQDLGQLASALSGPVAQTLSEANMSLGQAGEFTAKMLELGAPGRQVMAGLATAMKDFGAEGLSFSDGIKAAGQRLQELGDTPAGQDLAEHLFGTRNWIVAKAAIAELLDEINKGPAAFDATSASTDEFITKTESLGNMIETFKHQAENAFKPFGDAAKGVAAAGLNNISNWFTTHQHEIIDNIKHWGDQLLDNMPKIQEFAASALRLAGEFATGLLYIWEPVATTLAAAGAGFLALTGHFSEAKDLLVATANFDPSKINDTVNNISDKIENFKGNSATVQDYWQNIRDSFDGIADAANRTPVMAGGGGIPAQGNFFNPGSSPQAQTGAGPVILPPLGGTPSGAGSPVLGGAHVADWEAISQAESSGRWNVPTPGPVPEGGGLQIKPGTWADFGGLQFAPKPYMASKADQETVANRILNGWNGGQGQGPSAWPDTYKGFSYGGDPTTGGAGGQGDPDWMPAGGWGPGGKTAWDDKLKGLLPNPNWNDDHHADSAGYHITTGSGSKDDVAALLKKGEYVWDTGTVDKYGWLIKGLHKGIISLDGGGGPESPYTGSSGVLEVIYSNTGTGQKTGEEAGNIVGPGTNQPGYYGSDWEGHQGHVHTSFATSPDGQFYGLPKGTDIRQGGSGFPQWVYALGAQFGLQASTYAGHQEASGYNRGIDWWPAGHADMSGASYTADERSRLQSFASSVSTYGAARPGGTGGSPQAWGMSTPLGYGMPRGGDGPNANFPGMDGQYGGYGTYGGETADQQYQLQSSLQSAKDRAADLDHEIQVKQQHITDLQDQISKVGTGTKIGMLTGKPEPLTPAEQAASADKTKKLNEELDAATYDLSQSMRDRSEQDGKISEADRKLQEGMLAVPKGAKTGTAKVPGQSEFSQLGGSLLSGIGQELGFGDIFSKPPWEWGAVKLLTGAAGWAIGTANAWADQIGAGKTGIGGPGWGNNSGTPMPGFENAGGSLLSGLSGSLGINLPKLATPSGVSTGPNVVPGQSNIAAGQGGGPAPGPADNYYDQSIHVSSDVDSTKVLAPVHELQNSANSTYFGINQGPNG